MKDNLPAHVKESIDNILALHDRYLSGTLNLKALSPVSLIDLERDFQVADKHLDYIDLRGLSDLRQMILSAAINI
jgi:hypothetical protein